MSILTRPSTPATPPSPSFGARIAAALTLWSKRRDDLPIDGLDEFARLMTEASEPGTVETALVRLAFRAAGPEALRVELLRDRGYGLRRVAAWPAIAGAPSRTPTTTTQVDLPLRCGGQDRGTLRIIVDGPRPIDPDRHRRLTTLAVLAAAADRCRVDADETSGPAATAVDPTHDAMTGLPNSAFLESFLTYALALADRRNEPLTLLTIGVDRLNAIGDLHGPDFAAEALRKVGRVIATTLRASDLIARIDDGRIVAVLPGASEADAMGVAESIRVTVAATGIATPSMPMLTSSIGLATYPTHAEDALALRASSASALSVARSKGHNRIAVAPLAQVAEAPTLLRIAHHAG